MKKLPTLRGRGVTPNPPNHFERLSVERDEWSLAEDPAPSTEFLVDSSRSIIATNASSDVGFDASVNPYRGCEHGCVYCYARPTHEYLGLSAGLDFESKIFVKRDAAKLLRKELLSPRWKPKPLALSGVTDPYQPIERRMRITRGCLEVITEFRNPVLIVTKSFLVTRDIDLLAQLALHEAVGVAVSITTLGPSLHGTMEPRASIPVRRLDTIQRLTEAGIPVAVFVAPIIPGLNDHEIPAILEAAAARGATAASCVPIRLPFAVKDLFVDWLGRHFPDRKDKVVNRIRAMRGGRLNDLRLGSRMRGEGPMAEQVIELFRVSSQRVGLSGGLPALSTKAFRRPGGVEQLGLGV
jgi:DNA repair photolyase